MKSLETRLRKARQFDPDLIEIRLDFIRNLDSEKLLAIKNFLEGNEILTIRSALEGGKSNISEKSRIELLHDVISRLKPSLVDIEILTLGRQPSLIHEIEKSKTGLIASFHDIHGLKDTADLRKILLSAPLQNRKLYAAKIVSHAKSFRDNLRVLELYPSFNHGNFDSNSRLVAFCTGQFGIPSRILSLFLGSPFAYVSLSGEPAAPGQLDINTMRKMIGMRA